MESDFTANSRLFFQGDSPFVALLVRRGDRVRQYPTCSKAANVARVWQRRHHFGPFPRISQLDIHTKGSIEMLIGCWLALEIRWVVAMGCCYGWMLLGAHAYRMLVCAFNPML